MLEIIKKAITIPMLETFRNLREYCDQLDAQKFEKLMKQKII